MDEKRWQSRTARLARLLSYDAPPHVIAHECKLVLEAYRSGGRWAVALWLFADFLAGGLIYAEMRAGMWAERLACRLLHRHYWAAEIDDDGEETGREQCLYCDRIRAEVRL